MGRVSLTTNLNSKLLDKLSVLSIIENNDVNDIIEKSVLLYIDKDPSDLCSIEDNPALRVRFTSTYDNNIITLLRKKANSEGIRYINRLMERYAASYIQHTILAEK